MKVIFSIRSYGHCSLMKMSQSTSKNTKMKNQGNGPELRSFTKIREEINDGLILDYDTK